MAKALIAGPPASDGAVGLVQLVLRQHDVATTRTTYGPMHREQELLNDCDALVVALTEWSTSLRTTTRAAWANRLNRQMTAAVQAKKPIFVISDAALPQGIVLPEAAVAREWSSIDDLRRHADDIGRALGGRARSSDVDLRAQRPAGRPAGDDGGIVASQAEGLLAWADRAADDASLSDDVREEVERRRRQLADELALIGRGAGSSAVLGGLVAALLPLVRPAPAEDPLGAAADEVADATIALGEATSNEELVAAGEDVVAALEHVGDEIGRYGGADVKEAALRSAGAWFEEDARGHLNAFIVAAREKVLPAGAGPAGGVVTSWMGGPPWLVVTVVALGLLRARFPWIFRPPPPPPPSDGG